MTGRRSFWGWGAEAEAASDDQLDAMAAVAADRYGVSVAPVAVPSIDELDLRAPRVSVPDALAGFCSTAPFDRAGHTYGKGFRDVVRALRRDFANPPDVVAFPNDEAEITAVLDWASDAGVAVVPYGGGSSVVGGVEPDASSPAVVSLDLARLDRVVEIDGTSRAARIQAGVLGPALEEQLRPHGLTLRHFPQSFEFSSLGGWIATRSGGHYATLYTHIDDFVESLRVVTPSGVVESRRLPGSGAGPSPDRTFIGSEGTLGVITEAWMRLQDRPTFRATASVRFDGFDDAVEAVRSVSQSGLYPTNCRLLDPVEALGAGGGGDAVLVLGFESADHPRDTDMQRAVEIVSGHGGRAEVTSGEGSQRSGAAGSWRSSFIRAPYLRDAWARLGCVADTFETSITWDRFGDFHDAVTRAATDALERECGAGTVSCRFTHVYPDGPAPYYTCIGPATIDTSLERSDAVKEAAADAVMANGGTITHHHAVGRDHKPWYEEQRPNLWADAMRAAKTVLDPAGVLNPGVLL